MDALHQIEVQILELVALAVGSVAVLALQRLAAWFRIKLRADQVDMLNAAVDKVMTLGVTKASDVIRDRGWDHVDSKNAVINFAIGAIGQKFESTLADNGVDLDDPARRLKLIDMMERMWPDVAARASASPATPPAPAPTVFNNLAG
jgi:uncharacterized membrane protein